MAGSCEIFGLDQLLLLEHQKFHQTFIFFARLLDFKGLAEKKKLSVRGLDGAMNFIQKMHNYLAAAVITFINLIKFRQLAKKMTSLTKVLELSHCILQIEH